MLRMDDIQRQAVDLFPKMWYRAFKRSVYGKNYLLTYAEQLVTDVELFCPIYAPFTALSHIRTKVMIPPAP